MIAKSQIVSLIKIKRKNNFFNHFLTFDNTNDVYFGDIRKDEVFLWKKKRFLRKGYPLFHFTFNKKGELQKLEIIKKPFWQLNVVILILCNIFFIVLFYRAAINIKQFLLFVSWIGITEFLVIMILRKMIKFESNLIKLELKEKLISFKNLSNEKSLIKSTNVVEKKKDFFGEILVRFFTYPFSIIIIIFSLLNFFEKPFLAVFGILISLSYLIADILILRGKKMTKNSFFNFLND